MSEARGPALWRASKRIDDAQGLEAAEIAVAGEQLGDAVLEAQGGNVSVVNQVPCRARLANDLIEEGDVAFRFGEQYEGRRSEDASQIIERNLQRDRRMEHPGVRYNPKELIDAGPWDRPRKSSLGEALEQLEGGGVAPVRLDFGVNQDVRVDGLHDSSPVHQVKQGVTIQKIDSGEFGGFPALKTQLVRPPRASRQRLAQEVVGYGLEGSPLFRGFFLQGAKKPFLNRQGGSLHMQKHTPEASR
jgi:hypothetical protein